MKPNLMRMTRSLKEDWQQAVSPLRANPDVTQLVTSLNEGRFNFAREAWHTANGEMASELLLRAWDKAGNKINRTDALFAIARDGSFPAVSRFLVLAALAKTDGSVNETLSINLLPSVAACPTFWEQLEKSLNGHKRENIIFEILEYEANYPVDHTLLKAAVDKGYRFALDDFAADAKSWQRLEDFAPYLSFVKIDGPLVRDGFKGNKLFEETLARLRTEHPGKQIVAEFVQSEAESKALYDMGVTAVQGSRLPRSRFSTVRPV